MTSLRAMRAVLRLRALGLKVDPTEDPKIYFVNGMRAGQGELSALAAKPDAEIVALVRAAAAEQRRRSHNARQRRYQARKDAGAHLVSPKKSARLANRAPSDVGCPRGTDASATILRQ